MNEFDSKAAEWDQNPMHWDRSVAIADDIIKQIPLNKEMIALEYGAGTGITSFLLKDHLKEITMMDNSAQMVYVMEEKIRKTNSINLRALNFNLEDTEFKEMKFDLIYTQMVLHHVDDVETIINRFYALLKPDGYLAIADLYKEDGSFHGDGFKGHKGFDIQFFSEMITKHNFKVVSHNECFVIDRVVSDSETISFPVFLLIATRNLHQD